MSRHVICMIAAMGLCGIGAAATACETIVQLDRNAVDAGGDAGCPICSDASDEGDSGNDAGSTDGPTDDASSDAGAETATADTGTGG
jgi:hypothetical protein